MAKRKSFNGKRRYKKYSFNERVAYHDKKSDSLWEKAKGVKTDLFKRKDFAYSQGYLDAARDVVQFSSVAAYGGNMKAYEAGVKVATAHKGKINNLKF